MNRDDIIRIAKEAALPLFEDDEIVGPLQRFAALVIQYKALDHITAAGQYEEGFYTGAAAEREACAKICDETNNWPIAAVIRARGKA